MNKDHIIKLSLFVIAFCLLVFTGRMFSQNANSASVKILKNEYASEDKITVELCGEVKNSGKYSVAVGTELHDVIYLAGGLSDSGDAKSVDLDKILTEPCKIVVERAEPKAYDAKEATALRTDGKYNINTASQSELENIKGIGESLAQRIINYRTINGSFKRLEDIQNVKGIGQKKYEAIRDFITVGGK